MPVGGREARVIGTQARAAIFPGLMTENSRENSIFGVETGSKPGKPKFRKKKEKSRPAGAGSSWRPELRFFLFQINLGFQA